MPVGISRDRQPDNTIRTSNYYRPINTDYVPRFLAPKEALDAIDAYKAMLQEWRTFDAEYQKIVLSGAEKAAFDTDKDAARKAVETGKPVTKPTAHVDAYRSKAAELEVRREILLERLVEAEEALESELSKPGDDALIERALEIAEERAVNYRAAIDAMLKARDHYRQALGAVAWAVSRTAGDKTPAVIPAGKTPPKPQAPFEDYGVSAILAEPERHKGRLDLIASGTKDIANAARRFMYKRLSDDPGYDPDSAPSGARTDRFIGERG